MTKEEYIRILLLLSKMEAFLLTQNGSKLPEFLSEEVSEVCELLAKKVSE